jgi:hypothetical protein
MNTELIYSDAMKLAELIRTREVSGGVVNVVLSSSSSTK